MLLTITNKTKPTMDLGYLLHKHPSKFQSFPTSFGKGHVFYPEATEERCTVALMLDIDPLRLVRGPGNRFKNGGMLNNYVNDRPYVVSSFVSVAIAKIFGTALSGKEKERPQLAEKSLKLRATLSVLPCKGEKNYLTRLFGPLGYEVNERPHLLDHEFLEWGYSPYYTVDLEYTGRLKELLSHLYVLIPVLDGEKHYWVGKDEVNKLLQHGGKWLSTHPEKELIAGRYLRHQKKFVRDVLAGLTDEGNLDPDALQEKYEKEAAHVEKKIGLNTERVQSVIKSLKKAEAGRVLDLGCGYGHFLKELLDDKYFTEIVGLDVSLRILGIARKRLQPEKTSPDRKNRLKLMHGSLLYRDKRLAGYDAAVAMEVIEHLDPPRLASFERVVFEFARPGTIIITTPNVEYNVKFDNLSAGKYRHKDHRFEWSRKDFQNWAEGLAKKFRYSVRFESVGQEDPDIGPPTQMGVFTL